MFFKDIWNWTDKKLKSVYAICLCVYFVITVLIPAIFICINYGLFDEAVETKTALSGSLIIVILATSIMSVKLCYTVINRMKQTKVSQQRLKFTLLLVLDLILPITAIVLLVISRNQLLIAFKTIIEVIVCYACGKLVDRWFLNFIDCQLELRDKVDEEEEKDKIKQARAKRVSR